MPAIVAYVPVKMAALAAGDRCVCWAGSGDLLDAAAMSSRGPRRLVLLYTLHGKHLHHRVSLLRCSAGASQAAASPDACLRTCVELRQVGWQAVP